MQKDDLDIDLHALIMKLEQALPQYKTLQYQLDELNAEFRRASAVNTASTTRIRAIRRQFLEQATQQIELLEKDSVLFKGATLSKFITQMEQCTTIC